MVWVFIQKAIQCSSSFSASASLGDYSWWLCLYVSGGASKRSDRKGKHIIFHEKNTEIVCELTEALFSRKEMVTSSLSGKHSNAHKYKEPKSQLCPAKVKAICGELLVVWEVFCFPGLVLYCKGNILCHMDVSQSTQILAFINLKLRQLVVPIESYCCGSFAGFDTTGDCCFFQHYMCSRDH